MTTFMVVASALHQKIKFPVGNEVAEVQGDQVIARKCYVEEVRIEQKMARTDNIDRPGLPGMEQVNLIEDTFVTVEEEIEEIMIFPPSGMIPLAKEDKDKVSFVTSTRTYCNVVMPFGLKNAETTYQRLMDKTLKNNQMKLNPNKCTFGVWAGKFLGYMVTKKGIEANPEKVQAIISMSSFRNIQEGKELFLYLAVTPRAASSVLVRKEGINHQPVYFVNHALKGAELNYLTQEKLALALVITTRKLRPYFLSHPITVLTNSALEKIASNPNASERLVRWITELSEYGIKFEPRTTIKAQALADFLAETVQLDQEELWRIFVDGSSCLIRIGAEIVIISPWGEETNISISLDFRASNNEAEYKTLLLGLKAARNLGISQAVLYSNSQLAIQQSNGKFETKDEKMMKYAKALDKAKEGFTELNLEIIPRAENIKADHLARLTSALNDQPYPIISGRKLVSQLETLDDIIDQRHANLQWRPAEYMKVVVAACRFDQLGMDIVGSFPVSTGQRKFLLVAVDYFYKWVKVMPLAKITEKSVQFSVEKYSVPFRDPAQVGVRQWEIVLWS
ncbi:uncharacterized protein [Henckelia pumila]|uniref:uncharacterized protein n=1 Tax=Henckelia pumila TaxID=405737 RepID=UPI003C6E6DAF